MKDNIIVELENKLIKEREILLSLKLKMEGSGKEIEEIKSKSIWSNESPMFGLITVFIIGFCIWYFLDWKFIGGSLMFICGGLSLIGLSIQFFLSIGRVLHESDIKKIKKEIQKQEEIIESIENNKDEILGELKTNFIKELDSNKDTTIDVIQQDDEFMKILKSNQKLILEMEKSENRDFIKNFVKLSNFLVDKEKNLQSIFLRISDIKTLKQFNSFKPNFIEQIQFYNVMRLNSLQMISSFIDDDRITFYLIYEKFDRLGVWNTNFENQFLFKIDTLNSNIEGLIFEIKEMSNSINYSINDLISITEENTFSLSDKLKEIGSKLDVSNMLNTINTYQNYKTNKRLR